MILQVLCCIEGALNPTARHINTSQPIPPAQCLCLSTVQHHSPRANHMPAQQAQGQQAQLGSPLAGVTNGGQKVMHPKKPLPLGTLHNATAPDTIRSHCHAYSCISAATCPHHSASSPLHSPDDSAAKQPGAQLLPPTSWGADPPRLRPSCWTGHLPWPSPPPPSWQLPPCAGTRGR